MKNLTKKQKTDIFGIALLIVAFIIYAIISITYKYPFAEHITPTALNKVAIPISDRIQVRWYAIFVVGGAAALSVFGYYRYLKPLKLDSDNTLTGVTFGILFGILGARLYYVLFEHTGISFDEGFFRGILQIINPSDGGLAIHGALYGACIYIFFFTRKRGLKLLEIIEIVLPVFMLAQVVGRWGNFFNQEAYGPLVGGFTNYPLTDEQLISQRETLRHLLVPNFVIDNMYIKSYVKVAGYYHPTFFYEGVANLFGAVAYLILRKKSKKIYIGDGISFYLFWYGFVRLFIEILRQDPLTFPFFGMNIKVAILTSVIFMIVGILLFILRRVFKFHLVSCREFIYNGGTLWKEGYGPKGKIIEEEKEEINTNKVVFFDCDGTLLDTFTLIEKTTMRVFDELLPDYQYTIEEIHAFFGPLLNESFAKYAKDEEQLEQLVERYRVLNKELHEEYIKSFDGIYEMLQELKQQGITTVIVSNKVTSAIIQGLQICGIHEFIDEVVGVEKLSKPKPDPDGIYELMEKYNIDRGLFVGDTEFDITTVNNVKTKYPNLLSVGVTWCKTSREKFNELNADYVIDKPSELVEVIKNYE